MFNPGMPQAPSHSNGSDNLEPTAPVDFKGREVRFGHHRDDSADAFGSQFGECLPQQARGRASCPDSQRL